MNWNELKSALRKADKEDMMSIGLIGVSFVGFYFSLWFISIFN